MTAPCPRFRPAAQWGRERIKEGSQLYVKLGQEGTLFRQGFGTGTLSGSVAFYEPTEVSNRSADLFGRSAAFCCRSRTPTGPSGNRRPQRTGVCASRPMAQRWQAIRLPEVLDEAAGVVVAEARGDFLPPDYGSAPSYRHCTIVGVIRLPSETSWLPAYRLMLLPVPPSTVVLPGVVTASHTLKNTSP